MGNCYQQLHLQVLTAEIGWLAAVPPNAIYNHPHTKPNHQNDDRRRKSDIGQEAFVALRVRRAIAKCITNQEKKENRQAHNGGGDAAPSTTSGGASLITITAHADKLAIDWMTARASCPESQLAANGSAKQPSSPSPRT